MWWVFDEDVSIWYSNEFDYSAVKWVIYEGLFKIRNGIIGNSYM